jgi:hypothetical protein
VLLVKDARPDPRGARVATVPGAQAGEKGRRSCDPCCEPLGCRVGAFGPRRRRR